MSVRAWDPDLQTPTRCRVYCFGCNKTFQPLAAYWRHDCPDPESGEAFK